MPYIFPFAIKRIIRVSKKQLPVGSVGWIMHQLTPVMQPYGMQTNRISEAKIFYWYFSLFREMSARKILRNVWLTVTKDENYIRIQVETRRIPEAVIVSVLLILGMVVLHHLLPLVVFVFLFAYLPTLLILNEIHNQMKQVITHLPEFTR